MDCHDAALVARFWAKTLGTPIVHGDRVSVDGLWLAFRPVPDRKYVRNRLRLGLVTYEFEFEAARLLSLGAVRLADDGARTTFADVEGNEFDLIDGREREPGWPPRT